jgi:hypothetical protein
MTRPPLSPLEAYDLSAAQKERRRQEHLHRVIELYDAAARRPAASPAEAAFVAKVDDNRGRRPDTPLAVAVQQAYRDVAFQFGLRRIKPCEFDFQRGLDLFFENYKVNFPILAEQETKKGFRELWHARRPDSGYEERGYSVICPLTGEYLAGLEFSIQPESDSVHFVYGFVMPWVRGGWGFGAGLLAVMRDEACSAIADYFRDNTDKEPPWRCPRGPLIIFEKNSLDDMTVTDVLMDSASVDVNDPPRADADLSLSSISQSLRDLAWRRLGGKIISYNYLQSSLEGVVEVPPETRDQVIRLLNKKFATSEAPGAAGAERALSRAIGKLKEGCRTLSLCAFVGKDVNDLPAAQVRRHNEIFQSISVAKVEADKIKNDIYFEAQMQSLQDNSIGGRVRLDEIEAAGSKPGDFRAAEALTRRLLALVTWDELRESPDRTFHEWLAKKCLLVNRC